MNTYRRTAIIVGVLFLLGFAGVAGPTVLTPILDGPGYLTRIYENQSLVLIGALCQMVMACACAGIAIGLYPILKKYSQSLALGAVGFRLIENVLALVSALGLLSLVSLSQRLVGADPLAVPAISVLGDLLLDIRFWASLVLSQWGWAIGAAMYYYVFYRSNLIPRWLSGWGLIAILLHFSSVFITMFTQTDPFSGSWTILMNIPVGLQELTLAVWLIVKGFNPSAVASLSGKTTTSELVSAS
jgi:hypothetical protein